MKLFSNFFTFFNRGRAGVWKAASLALPLVLVSCGNIFSPPSDPGDGVLSAPGTVRISLDDSLSMRTLMPQEFSFARYKLSYTGGDGSTIVDDNLYPANFAGGYAKSLAAGTWTITAEAFAQAGDSSPAARGSVSVSLTANGQAHAGILLRPLTSEGTGTFVYRIDDPGNLLDGGQIVLYAYTGGGNWDYYDNQVFSSYLAPYNNNIGVDVEVPVSPGIYLVQVSLYPSSSSGLTGTLRKTEIVHIYSNLVTRADYTLTAADFTAGTIISGTIDFRVNGIPQGNFTLSLYLDDSGLENRLAFTSVSLDSGSYQLVIPRPDKAVRVYFFADYSGISVMLGYVDLAAGEANRTHNIYKDARFITLSGSVSLLNAASGESFRISVYSAPEGYDEQRIGVDFFVGSPEIPEIFDGNWSIDMEALPQDIPLYFFIWFGDWHFAGSVTGGSANRSGINLGTVDTNRPTVAGKVELIINGQTPSGLRIEAYSDFHRTNLAASAPIDAQGKWILDHFNLIGGQSYAYVSIFWTLNGTEYRKDIHSKWIELHYRYNDLGRVDITPLLTLSGTVNNAPADRWGVLLYPEYLDSLEEFLPMWRKSSFYDADDRNPFRLSFPAGSSVWLYVMSQQSDTSRVYRCESSFSASASNLMLDFTQMSIIAEWNINDF